MCMLEEGGKLLLPVDEKASEEVVKEEKEQGEERRDQDVGDE